MRLSSVIVASLLQLVAWRPVVGSSAAVSTGSFYDDVVRSEHTRSSNLRRRGDMEDALLSKAVPLAEYKAMLAAQGLTMGGADDSSRRLEEDEDDQGDDYYLDANNMFSFSGYSMKYAKCQPIQKFSEDAVQSGEHTPMVTEDVVILRLCPSRFCLSSRTYGCQYNFAEYAIGLSDYVRVMLRYSVDRKEQMCGWCNTCAGNRRHRRAEEGEGQQGEGEGGEGEGEGEDHNDEEEDRDENEDQGGDGGGDEEEVEADDYYAAGDDDGNAAANNNGDDSVAAEDGCEDYYSYCVDEDGASVCADSDDDSYLDTLDYLDYLYCTKISDNDNYNYYVRPRCDGEDGSIKMAVYHDEFCSQYAGNDVSLKNFGLGFRESIFKPFYEEDSCIDCSESNYPPYYNANSNMCNRMHTAGGSCTNNMVYDLFGQVDDDSTVCSFIESIRFDTYDAYGRLVDSSSSQSKSNRTVTEGQKFGLAFSVLLCAILAVYSCYLHHSITNLLIKSLSHTDLLPPSRHKGSRSVRSSRSKTRRSRKSSPSPDDDDEDGDGDWDVRGVPA